MNRTNWKIAEKSKRKIVQALLDVMGQYDYREITVTQITQEARLSRKTFYRLFSSKDDILTLLFEESFQNFLEQVKEHQIKHYWDLVQLFFNFWEDRKELLRLLYKNHLLPLIFERSYQCSMEIFELIRSKEIADSFALPLPYLLAYSVGGMHSMLLKWVENGMDIPSAELISTLKLGFMSDDI